MKLSILKKIFSKVKLNKILFCSLFSTSSVINYLYFHEKNQKKLLKCLEEESNKEENFDDIYEKINNLSKKGNFEELLSYCEEKLKKNPDSEYFLLTKTLCLYILGKSTDLSYIDTLANKINLNTNLLFLISQIYLYLGLFL
jgi:hypothetical protein